MNSPTVLCLCLTSLTVGIFCAAQDLSFPKGWTAASFPGSTSGMSDDLRCANYSSNEWHVKVNGGVVQISRPPEPKGKGRTVEELARSVVTVDERSLVRSSLEGARIPSFVCARGRRDGAHLRDKLL